MSGAQAIAQGLSDAQRRVLLRMPGTFGGSHGRAGEALTRKGLVEDCPRYAYRHVLTPLGVAVRASLTQDDPDA
jgi:hypothetical protein